MLTGVPQQRQEREREQQPGPRLDPEGEDKRDDDQVQQELSRWSATVESGITRRGKSILRTRFSWATTG